MNSWPPLVKVWSKEESPARRGLTMESIRFAYPDHDFMNRSGPVYALVSPRRENGDLKATCPKGTRVSAYTPNVCPKTKESLLKSWQVQLLSPPNAQVFKVQSPIRRHVGEKFVEGESPLRGQLVRVPVELPAFGDRWVLGKSEDQDTAVLRHRQAKRVGGKN